jgi:PPOX class probable F420-dependent enzyme
MREMTEAEAGAFLMSGRRTATIATVSPAGAPHVVPVWFTMEAGFVVFTTMSRSVKGRNLAADPRVSICVDDEDPPYAFVTLTGRASFEVRPAGQLELATRIAERYVGAGRADEVGRINVALDDLVVRVTVERVVARTEILPSGAPDPG